MINRQIKLCPIDRTTAARRSTRVRCLKFVGRRINHKFVIDSQGKSSWFKGTVLQVERDRDGHKRNSFRKLFEEGLSHPKQNFIGRLVKRHLETNNAVLEREAARLCDIQPNHQVLEIGFGPGLGLEAAYQYVKAGKGSVYGVEISEYMMKTAFKRNEKYVKAGKLKLMYGSATNLRFDFNSIDRVFHCDNYFYWPNGLVVAQELHRVMKPHGLMVTTLNIDAIKHKLIKTKPYDPLQYMAVLESVGFKDVNIQYLEDEISKEKYQAIFAYIGEEKENLWVKEYTTEKSDC